MNEQKILQSFLNGQGVTQLKGLRFMQYTTLANAEADTLMTQAGAFCQVGTIIYYRATVGQALKAVIDEAQLATQLTTLQNNVTNQIAQSKAFTPFDASSAGSLPTGASVKNGQGFYVTGSGTVGGLTFTANDVFFAKQDNPTLAAHFGDIVPIASIATAGIAGVVKIATTLAEYNAGITDANLSVSAPVINSLLSTITGSINTIVNSKELEINPTNVTNNGIVASFNSWVGAISDKTRIVTTGLLKNLYDFTVTTIASMGVRITDLETRNSKKYSVEITDANGAITETFYTGLQGAIDFADTQTTATSKRILVRQDVKITSTIKLKSSIVIDFTDHDVYAVSDLTLFDDALMSSTNGGHIELIGIKDLVVAISDSTGSTNAILKTTGTGTNRRYRLHAENIYSAISLFKSSSISTNGTATQLDILVENVLDCYSTSGNIVSNYNDRYGAITAHHSTRVIDIASAAFKVDIVVGKFLRCMGFIHSMPFDGSGSTYCYLECPTVRIMMSYLASGSQLHLWFHVKNSLTTAGASFVKILASGLFLNSKNSIMRSLGASGDFTGSLATYHAAGDAVMNTPASLNGVPVITFYGTCILTAVTTLFYQASVAVGIETYIIGTLCSNIELNSVVKGGQLITDTQFNPPFINEPNLR